MFEDPVCAGGSGGEAHGDAVAGGFDFREVDVDFGYDAGHVDSLIVYKNQVVSNGIQRNGRQ